MHVRLLTPADAAPYRALMLEAYEQASDAFTSTAEERRAEPLTWWTERIAAPDGRTLAFGAWDDEALVGTVALECSAKPKTRHSALVIGMYVQPAARGRGAGAMLLRATLDAAAARPALRTLRLTVTEGNEPAIRLYASLGFATWGVEPMALRMGEAFRGRVHMWRPLPAAAAPAAAPH
jgi:RimJ/RimL family protein N-acetyltransferase